MQLPIRLFILIALALITACKKNLQNAENQRLSATDTLNSDLNGGKNKDTLNQQKKEDAESVKENCDEGELRALGWSEDGRIFAYRDFYYRNGIEINSDFYAAVIDVVTDSVLWEYSKHWYIGNTGEGDSDPYVSNMEEAWSLVAQDVIVRIRNIFGIEVSRDFQEHEMCKDFPLYLDGPDGPYFTAEVLKDEKLEAPRVKVNVFSSLTGVSKNVCDIVEEGGMAQNLMGSPCVSGYFINPQNSKIVILFQSGYGENNGPLVRQHVTGCNLKSFKNH